MKKEIFHTPFQEGESSSLIPKQTFDQSDLTMEAELKIDSEMVDEVSTQFTQIVQSGLSWWKKWLIGSMLFFLVGVVAQSIQWLIDSWQNHQWIYFSFACASCTILALGGVAIANECYKLIKLKRRMRLQERSQNLLTESAVVFCQDFSIQDIEEAKKICDELTNILEIPQDAQSLICWKARISDGLSASEIMYMFSQTVLTSIDLEAKKLVSKNAIESAIAVAVSPLAVVDMLFVAWRNIHLINQLAKLYHIELGYFSRLRLFRMVLGNMVFAGATEMVKEMGIDWLSQDISAKLSGRLAQGIGVGILTARLGIKAMEFCRPLPFTKEEKPHLKHIYKEILSNLKQ